MRELRIRLRQYLLRHPTEREVEKAKGLVDRYGYSSVLVAMQRLEESGQGVGVEDIEEVLRDPNFPPPLLCEAYASGDRHLIALAEEIEELMGYWFPPDEVVERRRRLEERLARLLRVRRHL